MAKWIEILGADQDDLRAGASQCNDPRKPSLEVKDAIRFYEANGFRHLTAPLGSSGHGHNDCWLILDLEMNGSE